MIFFSYKNNCESTNTFYEGYMSACLGGGLSSIILRNKCLYFTLEIMA